jgi:PKD repeat protein
MKNLLWAVIIPMTLLIAGCDEEKDNDVVPPPVASFTYSGRTVAPATITYTNLSQNADLYMWDLGGRPWITDENPVYIYYYPGDFGLKLWVRQTSTGIYDDTSMTISITAPTVWFLDSIFVDIIPFTNSQGGAWDAGSGPDLFLQFEQGTSINVAVSQTFPDVAADSLPLRTEWSVMAPDTMWDQDDCIALYDLDDAPQNELIGRISFSIQGAIAHQDYYESEALMNPEHTLLIRAYWHWQ